MPCFAGCYLVCPDQDGSTQQKDREKAGERLQGCRGPWQVYHTASVPSSRPMAWRSFHMQVWRKAAADRSFPLRKAACCGPMYEHCSCQRRQHARGTLTSATRASRRTKSLAALKFHGTRARSPVNPPRPFSPSTQAARWPGRWSSASRYLHKPSICTVWCIFTRHVGNAHLCRPRCLHPARLQRRKSRKSENPNTRRTACRDSCTCRPQPPPNHIPLQHIPPGVPPRQLP